MKTSCPKCQAQYEVEDSAIGQRVECPACKNKWIVEDVTIWTGSSHPSVFFAYYFFSMILFAVPVAFEIVIFATAHPHDRISDMMSPIPLFLMLVILGTILFCAAIIMQKTTVYSITGKNIVISSGFFTKTENIIRISDIRNISTAQTWIEQMFHIGDLKISSSATSDTADIKMSGIPDYKTVLAIIEEKRIN